jgi:hypothetical protein
VYVVIFSCLQLDIKQLIAEDNKYGVIHQQRISFIFLINELINFSKLETFRNHPWASDNVSLDYIP